MQTHLLHVADGRERVDEIRRELFALPGVLDVFVTSRPDSVVVVCEGRPHLADWSRTLRTVGFDVRARPSVTPPDVRLGVLSAIPQWSSVSSS